MESTKELTSESPCREYSLTLTKVEEAKMWFDQMEDIKGKEQ